jgi:hypothetical protein
MSPRVLLALGAGGAFALRIRPLYDLDVGWHLTGAREVLRHGSRIVPEPTALDGPATYTNGEWGFGVLALALHALGGTDAIVVATGVLAVLSMLAVAWSAREAGADAAGATAIAGVVAFGTSHHFLPRPQSLFLVLLPVTMALALRVRRGDTRALLGLHALFAVWAQVHGSVVIAPVVAGALALGRSTRAPHLVGLALLALWPLTGAHGVGVVTDVLRHTDTDATRYITDMRPPTWAEVLPPSDLNWLIAETIAVTALLLGVRRPGAAGPAALWLLGAALTATANRFRAAWEVLVVPLAALGLAATPRPAAALGLMPLAMALLIAGGTGLGLDRAWIPEAFVEAIRAHDVRGRMFNEYGHGGWLGWRVGDRVRLFIDGRTPTQFDADDLFAVRMGMQHGVVFDRLDAMHRFDAVAVRRFQPVCGHLASQPGWTPVWRDDELVLFVRSPARDAPVEVPCLPPWDPTPPEGDGGRAEAATWAAWRAAGRDADVVRAAHRVLDHHGHEAAGRVRLELARACLALDDVPCAAREGWRAALLGEPGAEDVLAATRGRVAGRLAARVDHLLATVGR